MVYTNFARLGALLLLASTIGVDALHLNFKRTPVPEHAKALLSRRGLVTRSAPSRISARRDFRFTKRQSDEGDDEPDDDADAPSDLKAALVDYYTANITVGGQEYLVVLDTSNSDLLLDNGPETGEKTEIRVEAEYQTHGPTLKVDGVVGIAPVTFGTYNIDAQAYLDIEAEDEEFIKTFGFNGFFGLGIESSVNSKVNEAVQAAEGEDSKRGWSLLQNIFASQPDRPQFIALDLARKDDQRDIDNFDISFGEYPEEWSEIKDGTKIPLFPEDAETWNIVVSDISLDETPLDLISTIKDVPKGSALAHITAGQPFTILPLELFDELYETLEGSAGFLDSKGEKRWLIPCLTTSILTLTASDVTIYIHPLDISEIWTTEKGKPEALKDHTVCVSSFRGIDKNREDVDIVLGSSFLRNVQTVFGFPVYNDDDTIKEAAYFQMQADTEDIKMEAQVKGIRGEALKSLPAELDPLSAVALIKGDNPPTPSPSPSGADDSSTDDDDTDEDPQDDTDDADTTAAVSTTTDVAGKHGNHHATTTHGHHRAHHTTTTTPHGGHHRAHRTANHDPAETPNGKTGNTLAKTVDGSESADDANFKRFLPVILGLLGANILVGLGLMVLAILNYIKKGAARKSGAHVYVPVGGKTADT